MAKVTSKLQVTVPKAVADRVGIRPGDDLEWIVDGDAVRVRCGRDRGPLLVADRLKIFDEATARQGARNRAWRRVHGSTRGTEDRGWTRTEIYARGRAR